MTALHLIRVPIDTHALVRWARERGWVRDRGRVLAFDEGRALHHLVDEVVGPGVLRPFRLLVPPRQTKGNLYAYSALAAESLRADAQIQALPEHLDVLSLDDLKSKPMPSDWSVGQRLGFDLRARPVRRLRRELEIPSGRRKRKGAEVDAFQVEALHRHPTDREGMASENRTREAVYLDWLAERLSGSCHFSTFQQVSSLGSAVTRVARGERGSEGPDATIHGTLTITDPATFATLLARGVGSSPGLWIWHVATALTQSPGSQTLDASRSSRSR